MGGKELKWRQLTHNQVMSLQGPHFSPHNTAKTNDKSTNLRKIVIGERVKRARRYLLMSMESRDIYTYVCF